MIKYSSIIFNNSINFESLKPSKIYYWIFAATIFLFSCSNSGKNELKISSDSLKLYKDSFRFNLGIGNYPKALDFGYKKLAGWKALDSQEKIFESKLDLACIYDRIADSKKAIILGNEALEYFKKTKDTFAIGYIYNLLSAFYGQDGQVALSKSYAQSAIQNLSNIPGEDALMGSSYNQLGCALADQGKLDSAILIQDIAIAFMRKAERIDQVSHTQLNNGNNYIQKGNPERALKYLYSARKTADSLGQLHIISGIDFRIAEAEELLGNYQKANKIINSALVLRDSLVSSENLDRISKLEVQYKTKELELANTKSVLKNRQKQIIIFIITTIFLIALLILLSFVFKYKKKIAVKNSELAANKKSLQDYLELLIQKNSQISELNLKIKEKHSSEIERENIEPIRQIAEDDPQNVSNVDISELDFFMETKILTADDWELFKQKFNVVFPGYIIALRALFPNFTQGEERHWLLIKANLNNKEISE